MRPAIQAPVRYFGELETRRSVPGSYVELLEIRIAPRVHRGARPRRRCRYRWRRWSRVARSIRTREHRSHLAAWRSPGSGHATSTDFRTDPVTGVEAVQHQLLGLAELLNERWLRLRVVDAARRRPHDAIECVRRDAGVDLEPGWRHRSRSASNLALQLRRESLREESDISARRRRRELLSEHAEERHRRKDSQFVVFRTGGITGGMATRGASPRRRKTLRYAGLFEVAVEGLEPPTRGL